MSEPGPNFQQLGDELQELWQSITASELTNEISELSETNRLQLNLQSRIASNSKVIKVSLTTGELLIGIPLLVGLDAIVIKTALGNYLISITSIEALVNLGKAKRLHQPNQKIFIPIMLKHVGCSISVSVASNQIFTGKLCSVWSDSIDIEIGSEVFTITFNSIIRIGLS